MTSTQFTDRSRFMAYQTCPRRRYLNYHHMSTGIQRIRGTVPLMTGSYVHAGMADVLTQVMALDKEHGEGAFRYVDVDRAVKVAVEGYRAEVRARGLDVDLGEDAQAVADEQIVLTEGLVRAYVKAPTGLEALLRSYRVVEVEREDVWDQFAPGITFQARADALLQERGSGDRYVLSWKTAAAQDYRKDNEGRHDVQGLSEVVVVERRLRQDWEDMHHGLGHRLTGISEGTEVPTGVSIGGGLSRPESGKSPLMAFLASSDQPPRIMGVQMVYLLKGIRRQAYDGGPYTTSSPLLRGWYRDGVTEREYAWKEETACPGPGHTVGYGKRGPILCEGKKFHKLGQGWTKFSVGAQGELSLGEWLDLLASGTVQPDAGNALDSLVWTPMPYFRQDRDMEDWTEQAMAQEALVVEAAADVERTRVEAPHALRRLLNISFPQYRSACDWPSACQFVPVCFGDDTMLTSPFASGMYQARTPHHSGELAQHAQLVQIATRAPLGDNGDNVQQAATEG